MILYDKEFYAFRFASAHMVDLDWGGGCWTVVCRHDDALIALIDHVTEIQEKFPNHGVCPAVGPGARSAMTSGRSTRQIEKTAAVLRAMANSSRV